MRNANNHRICTAFGIAALIASHSAAVAATAEHVAECRADAKIIRDALRDDRNDAVKADGRLQASDVALRLRQLKDVSEKIRLLDSKLWQYGVSETAAWPDRLICVAQYLKESKEAVRIAGVNGVDIASAMKTKNVTPDDAVLAIFDSPAKKSTVVEPRPSIAPMNAPKEPNPPSDSIGLLVVEVLAAIGILIYVVSQFATTARDVTSGACFTAPSQAAHPATILDGLTNPSPSTTQG